MKLKSINPLRVSDKRLQTIHAGPWEYSVRVGEQYIVGWLTPSEWLLTTDDVTLGSREGAVALPLELAEWLAVQFDGEVILTDRKARAEHGGPREGAGRPAGAPQINIRIAATVEEREVILAGTTPRQRAEILLEASRKSGEGSE